MYFNFLGRSKTTMTAELQFEPVMEEFFTILEKNKERDLEQIELLDKYFDLDDEMLHRMFDELIVEKCEALYNFMTTSYGIDTSEFMINNGVITNYLFSSKRICWDIKKRDTPPDNFKSEYKRCYLRMYERRRGKWINKIELEKRMILNKADSYKYNSMIKFATKEKIISYYDIMLNGGIVMK